MSRNLERAPRRISPRFVAGIEERLLENQRVRRRMPGWGRLHIDRQLPFLCVYRHPPHSPDEGTPRLVSGQAAYLLAPGNADQRRGLGELTASIAGTLGEVFGGFLLLELWAGEAEKPDPSDTTAGYRPAFRIVAPRGAAFDPLVLRLEKRLSNIRLNRLRATVSTSRQAHWQRPGLPPIMGATAVRRTGCTCLGLEVSPLFRDSADGQVYPLILRRLRRALGIALQQFFHDFACRETTQSPAHYHMLGRRAMVKAVWDVDRRLAELSESFDFLLQVTPVNIRSAWRTFSRRRHEHAPRFLYRPLEEDPALLKRRLYSLPLERVEDPTLQLIFRQKQQELDRQLGMLEEVETRKFLPGSLQVYGRPDQELSRIANDLLRRLPPRAREDSRGGWLDARSFADLAERELDHYRRQLPDMASGVHIRNDIAGGIQVSRGQVYVAADARIPATRAEALLQHEVGTHVLTYFNGRAQPFRQLYSGLSGYEGLQEGLAVLAEYLSGGLNRPRLRLLAGRVLGVELLVQGADFIETFRVLHREAGFAAATAYSITARIHRGGGLTKDLVYLQGLREVLAHLARGGKLGPILVGKIAAEHIPIINELQWRGVLRPAPLSPRYLEFAASSRLLRRLGEGMSIVQLIEGRPH